MRGDSIFLLWSGRLAWEVDKPTEKKGGLDNNSATHDAKTECTQPMTIRPSDSSELDPCSHTIMMRCSQKPVGI